MIVKWIQNQIQSINRQKKTIEEQNKPLTFTLKLQRRTITTNQQPYSQTPTLAQIITNKTKQLVSTIKTKQLFPTITTKELAPAIKTKKIQQGFTFHPL